MLGPAQAWQRNWAPPIDPGVETPFDWSIVLSLDMIRAHTKTDDIIGVSDDQLTFYRAAALEAAEQYTGLYISGIKTVTEPIEGPSKPKFGKDYYIHRLQYPVADGMVYLYGGMHPNDNRRVFVPKGTHKIKVPIVFGWFDLSNCCLPCSESHMNSGMWVAYKAGFASPQDVPALVTMGCLQFIAWVIEHPGDEILTVRNRRDARSEGASGTNSISIASGALESWRMIDKDIL